MTTHAPVSQLNIMVGILTHASRSIESRRRDGAATAPLAIAPRARAAGPAIFLLLFFGAEEQRPG